MPSQRSRPPFPLAGEGWGEGEFRFTRSLVIALIVLLGLNIEARADDYDLRIEVSGLRNYKGRVVLYLWADSDENSKFPDPSKVQFRDERPGDPPCDFPKIPVCRRMIESIQNLTVTYIFKNVPSGDYAVFVFHDENNNGILDTGFMRRPLEARGYSQILPDDIGPLGSHITFSSARFALNEAKTLVVGLRYPPRL